MTDGMATLVWIWSFVAASFALPFESLVLGLDLRRRCCDALSVGAGAGT